VTVTYIKSEDKKIKMRYKVDLGNKRTGEHAGYEYTDTLDKAGLTVSECVALFRDTYESIPVDQIITIESSEAKEE
jgi:hypothetical protein